MPGFFCSTLLTAPTHPPFFCNFNIRKNGTNNLECLSLFQYALTCRTDVCAWLCSPKY